MSNKTSDKNVANIEEDVKILEEFTEICKAGLACYDQTREGKALENILAEREQMLKAINTVEKEKGEWIEECEQKDKRIQELEEQVKTLDEAYTGVIKESKKWFDIAHNSIPKQVAIELIENETIDISGFECIAVEDLQELLEGEK